MSARALTTRPGIGITACVVQCSDLRFSRIVVDRPALILVRHGTKILQSAARQWTIGSGEAVAIAAGTFDVINRLSERGLYEARWLIWDPALIARFGAAEGCLDGAAALGRIDPQFTAAFDRALDAIADMPPIPDEVAGHRLAEMLVWLSERNVRFSAAVDPSLAARVRRMIEGSLAERWTARRVAQRLAVSEATLRRRLAGEGVTLGALLADIRMSSAMVLLQSTDLPINRIALDVGYESASRFAIRFRGRFGFAPTTIRRKGALLQPLQ